MTRARLLPLMLTGAMLLAACGGEDAPVPAEAPGQAGTPVAARDTVLPTVIEAAGTAEPVQQATLSTRLMASVLEVAVREGDRVQAGQLLVRLDTRDLDAKAAQVAAGLAEALAMEGEAAAMAERIRALYRDSAATQVQLDRVETGLARAQAAVRTARAAAAEVDAHRDYARITAPFAGGVVRRFVDPGAMAAPGAPLVMVEDASRLRVRVTAAPEHVRALARGRSVAVRIEGRAVTGEVEGVVRAVTGNMAQVNVMVPNRDGTLATGSAAMVELPQGARPGVVIPEAALVREGDLVGVQVVSPGGAERRWVRVGRSLPGGLVEVLSGLAAGDQVLVPPAGA